MLCFLSLPCGLLMITMCFETDGFKAQSAFFLCQKICPVNSVHICLDYLA